MEATRYAGHACIPCRTGKRKCNRVKPSCQACVQLYRACLYDEDAANNGHHYSAPPALTVGLSNGVFHAHLPSAVTAQGDNSHHRSLYPQAIDFMVSTEVQKVFTLASVTSAVIDGHFESVHLRLPILSRRTFNEDRQRSSNGYRADVAILCLAMYLAQQRPQQRGVSMQSSLYATTKMLISLLEASGYSNLRIVQCRVLVAWYELGHGLFHAALLSISSCSKAACLCGLQNPPAETSTELRDLEVVEEMRRTRWAIRSLDRFINLCHRQTLLDTKDPNQNELLPCEDTPWIQHGPILPDRPILAAPADGRVGQFARECQICVLAGRVLRHVYDPATDSDFQAQEKAQLRRTLLAYLPILDRRQLEFGRYCASFAICGVALLVLLGMERADVGDKSNEAVRYLEFRAMEEIANQIYYHERRCQRPNEFSEDDSDSFSPYVPLSVYQAAVIQQISWKSDGDVFHYEALNLLTSTLEAFARRWANAEFYLNALRSENPELLPPLS